MSVYSTQSQLKEIGAILSSYMSLPLSGGTIPGSIMEAVLARVRNGKALATYDFVDVVDTANKVGWQVKSTKSNTPLTWKRAKIPNGGDLINRSNQSSQGLQNLGDTIIAFCNSHVRESIATYGLEEVGYARLVVAETGEVCYFEKLLATAEKPLIFEASDFSWRWSKPKNTKKKEQLPALHGFHRETEEKWFAWHGLGENQLHFSGEESWWPNEADPHCIRFQFPPEKDRVSLDKLLEILSQLRDQA